MVTIVLRTFAKSQADTRHALFHVIWLKATNSTSERGLGYCLLHKPVSTKTQRIAHRSALQVKHHNLSQQQHLIAAAG
jgi:hypothetical protein